MKQTDERADNAPAAAAAGGSAAMQPIAANAELGSGSTSASGRSDEFCYLLKVHQSTREVDDAPFEVMAGEFSEQFYYNVPWPADSVAVSYGTVADNAAVSHHWFLFSTTEQQPEGSHFTAPLPTLLGHDPQLVASWAAFDPYVTLPDDFGLELPAPGRTLHLRWHFFNSTDMPQRDASAVRICTLPKAKRSHIGSISMLGTEDFGSDNATGLIGMPPQQDSGFSSTCSPSRSGQPIHIVGFDPHMHRLGRRMTSAIDRSNGSTEVIYDQPFDFGNAKHQFSEHVLMPGETLSTRCSFFNDTKLAVPYGESGLAEMCYQLIFHYPARSLTNQAFSLLGATDTCW